MDYTEQRKLADIGTPDPVCVTELESVRAVLALLRRHCTSAVVVVRERRPVGIFTERDALAAVAAGEGRSDRPVAQRMNTSPLCCPADLGYLEGYSRMARRGLRHLVLVNAAGEACGVVTEHDFVGALALDDRIEPLLPDAIAGRGGEDRFVRLFQAAPLAMVLTRLADEVILNANPAAAALSGYALDDLVGRTSAQAQAWVDARQRTDYLDALRSGRPVRALRAGIRRKDGYALTVEAYGEPVTMNGAACGLTMFVDVTPQCHHLRQIEHQHHLLAAVFEAIGDALILTDTRERILLANPAAAQVFGHPPERLLGRAVGLLFAEGDGLGDVAGAGGPSPSAESGVLRGRRADGTLFPAEVTLSWVGGGVEPAPSGQAVLVRDISERERRRVDLAEHQARLQDLLDAMADWVWEVDADTRYVHASERIRDLLGYEPAELIGKTPFDLMPGHEAERMASAFAAVAAMGEPFRDLENICLTKAGEPRVIATSGVPIRAADGSIRGWRGIDRDITEARRAAERLQASEAQLRAIFDHANVGIMLLTGYRIITRANRRLAEILGYGDPLELEGASVRDLHLSEANFAEFGERHYEQLRRREQMHVEYQLRRRDGGAVWCLLSGTALDPAQPADLAQGVIWTVEDISAIKENELALKSLNARLVEEHELFTSGPTMVFRWRPEPGWPVAQCTPNVSRRLAVSGDALAGGGFRFADLLHPDDLERVAAEVAAFTAQGVEGFEQEYRLRGVYGDWRHVYDYTRVRRDASGALLAYHGYLVDITERRRAIDALRASEVRHRVMFELAGQPMLTLDDGGRITAANRAACDLLACRDPDKLPGMTLAAISPPRQPDGEPSGDKAAALLGQAFETGRARIEWEHLRSDGRLLPVDVTLTRVELHGEPALLATWYDLSDRRRAEESEQRATAVFENTAEGIMLTDVDNRIVAVNPAFTAITGYSAEEAIGQRPALLHSGRQDREFYQAMWRQLEATGSWQGEIWNRRKDGELYAQWLSISEIRDADGSLTERIGVFSDITRMRRTEEELDQLTHYDPITGLPNQRLLRARLEQALQSAQVAGRPLVLMLLNLDGFKRVVASFGHEAADAVLAAAGERLAARLPADATLARTVGDTFAVAVQLEHRDASPSRRALLLQEAVREHLAVSGAGQIALSCCIGVAMYPADATTGPDLLRDADTALQRAKSAGPGSIAYYRPELTAAALRQLELERTLRTALEANQFELHFQPKLDLACRCIVGAEALIRWRRPDGVLVQPMEFMDAVEKSDLALDVDRWVLREAAVFLLAWQLAELPRVRVSVNVSAAMLSGGNLAAAVEAVLAETGVDPTLLEIEVLENILIEDPDHAEAELAAVGGLGVGIALDDFGTGYASLGYLKRFAFDYLKIDRGFITGLTTHSDDAAIVRATILMAHHLGIRVVAEGVEDDAQIRKLAALGCDLLQGYRIGKPMAPDEFAAMLGADARPLTDDLRLALRPRVLLVGDDAVQHGRIATQLEQLDWAVTRAPGAAAARVALEREPVDLLLCDQVLADGDAVELLAGVRASHPGVTRLLLLGRVEPADLVDAVNRGGVFRCLRRPCSRNDLAEAVQAGYEHGLRKLRAQQPGADMAR